MIKLKSKTLIEYFGKGEFTDEEIDKIDSINLINENPVEQDDIEAFREDLIKIAKANTYLSEIAINASSEVIPVEELLKNTPTENISFIGSEDIFAKMKDNKIEISNQLRRGLSLEADASEYDLFETLSVIKAYNSTIPTVDTKDLETVLKYIDIEDIKVHINSKEDYDSIQKYTSGKNIKLDVDIGTLKNTDQLWANNSTQIYLNVNKVKDLSRDELDMLSKNYNIKDIYMGNEYEAEREGNFKDGNFDFCSASEHYDVETYKRIDQELDELLEGVDKDAPELDRFLEVYKRIGNKVSYDHERKEVNISDNGTLFMGGLPEIHNLEAGLFEGLSVCEGYSKILHQALDKVGVESKFIVGQGADEAHAWNQVKIDGKWYNTDLTWDADNIKHGRDLDYCLQNDEDFLFHTPNTNRDVEECLESISPELVKDRLEIQKKVDIEDRVYSAQEAIKIIEKINFNNELGTRAAINEDLDNGGYILDLCNLKKDGYEWRDHGLKIGDIENVSKFITEYTKNYSVNNIEHSGLVDFVSTNEGINLVLGDQTKEVLKEYGMDCNEVLRLSQEKSMMQEEVTQEQMEQIQDEHIHNINENVEQSLKIYKPSLWRSIVTTVKNRFEKIKERFTNRNKNHEIEGSFDAQIKDSNEKEIENNVEQNMGTNIKQEEKLPSWDLRNWTQEQLNEAKEHAEIEKQRQEILRKQQEQNEMLQR